MIGTGMNGMETSGRGRSGWSEEYRLAHNLLKIIEMTAILRPLSGRASLLNSGD